MNSILFKNWTAEEFIGKWDGVEYRFAPGQSMYLEDWKAEHFAKHLTDKALQADNLLFNDFRRQEYLNKCFEATIEVDANKGAEEILNKNIEEGKVEEPVEAKKRGRPAKKDEKPQDDEFEGLK